VTLMTLLPGSIEGPMGLSSQYLPLSYFPLRPDAMNEGQSNGGGPLIHSIAPG